MTAPDSATDALLLSSKAGDIDGVSAALDEGATLSARDGDDWSALDWAAGCGNVAMVSMLLHRGADPTAKGSDGRTPYQIALAAGHLDAARILRDAEELADPASKEAHVWRPYCKAYTLGELRAAPMWSDSATDLTDDTIVYVHDDHTVSRSIWLGEDVVFADVSPQWIEYCRQALGFQVPDDFDLVPPAQSIGSS
ncbi:ankyrin repeat domain-containing protein [Rhizocola hellebori]|nr:ankyrin repeat domain-containing protein [Rhizocola hellebori]